MKTSNCLLSPGGCNALDAAKLLFAYIVVGIHQHPFAPDLHLYAWGWFQRLAVPFFFVTSAFLFFQRNPDGTALRRYIVRMLKLYAFWLVATSIHTFHLRYHPEWDVGVNLLHFLRILVNDSTFGGSWFISALIIAVPTVYWLEQKIGLWRTLAVALLVEVFLQSYAWTFALPDGLCSALKTLDHEFPDVHCSWLAALIYVSAGCALARRWERVAALSLARVRLATVVMLAAMGVWIIVQTDVLAIDNRTILLVPTVVLLFVSVARTELTTALPYRTFRKISTVVYISHFLFIHWLAQLSRAHFWALGNGPKYLLVASCATLFALVLIQLQRWRPLSWLKYAW